MESGQGLPLATFAKVCLSIKSKKKPTEKCNAKATKGEFCARHSNSKVLWVASPPSKRTHLTRRQKQAAEKIYKFWRLYGRLHLRRSMGPCTFVPDCAENDTDLLTLQPASEIPLKYRFSYIDSSNHAWIFDIRFFVQIMHYGNEIKNPFNQLPLTQPIIKFFQGRIEILRAQKIPVMYVEEGILTPEQVWNQKVLDIFLKMNSLGYAVNIVWFDLMTVRTHERFYTLLYNLWIHHLRLTDDQKEVMVPGHSSGRAPLFRWVPQVITSRPQELKWWRKQSLNLMRSFLMRGQDSVTQSSNVLTLLTALANCHRLVGEAFPWLITEY